MGFHIDPDKGVRDALAEDWPGLEVAARVKKEEIAEMRVVQNRTYQLALEAQTNQEYTRLMDIYGQECTRLLRLLEHQIDVDDRLGAYMEEVTQQVIREVLREWGR